MKSEICEQAIHPHKNMLRIVEDHAPHDHETREKVLSDISDYLASYIGEEVGINYGGTNKVHTVILQGVGQNCLCTQSVEDQTRHVIPFHHIMDICLNYDGISEGGFLSRIKTDHSVLIRIGPITEFMVT